MGYLKALSLVMQLLPTVLQAAQALQARGVKKSEIPGLVVRGLRAGLQSVIEERAYGI